MLRRLAEHVRPGGLIVFQEMDVNSHPPVPTSPLYLACRDWMAETLRRARLELDMGSKLYATFRRAGIPSPQMILGARVEAGPDSPGYDYLVQTVRSVLPMMEQFGVVSADVVGIDTLATRLREEVLTTESVIQFPSLIGAWAWKPQAIA